MRFALIAFLASLSFFHTSEFALAFLYDREHTTARSWLVSRAYCAAMALAMVEYVIEATLVPQLKEATWVSLIGLAAVISGESLRKAAIVTAKANFTQEIQRVRRANHILVTGGVYRYCRHPAYLGWFVWSVGTQILLANPACAVLFAYLAWTFFRDRIPYEEDLLLRFFGDEYARYAQRTPTWLPGIPSPVPPR